MGLYQHLTLQSPLPRYQSQYQGQVHAGDCRQLEQGAASLQGPDDICDALDPFDPVLLRRLAINDAFNILFHFSTRHRRSLGPTTK